VNTPGNEDLREEKTAPFEQISRTALITAEYFVVSIQFSSFYPCNGSILQLIGVERKEVDPDMRL
jgi:hypothetical protein